MILFGLISSVFHQIFWTVPHRCSMISQTYLTSSILGTLSNLDTFLPNILAIISLYDAFFAQLSLTDHSNFVPPHTINLLIVFELNKRYYWLQMWCIIPCISFVDQPDPYLFANSTDSLISTFFGVRIVACSEYPRIKIA